MPKSWVRERKRDLYYRLAKRHGFRSRAAYKLKQIQKKYRIISSGDVVVDLGAAPGGWMQVARELVGDGGFVLGVDLREVTPLGYENTATIKADVTEPDTPKRILDALPRKADVVLSDLAPNVSGIWELDQVRQIELAEAALKIAREVLKPGGNVLIKVFQGELMDGLVRKVKRHFRRVKLVKPKASRSRSAEIYVLGFGFEESN
ncbi:MAG TPA: RlmE family RNA methyltransferase [Candidatus Bathyarchaeota archaeon]|nr:RlmE family RNA methyltransferase [Candidatus Bathyarchaeota archaeon]